MTSPDGTRIAYRRVGSGPSVVVVHGALASSLSWLAVARRLADRFEFFLVDRRGRGDSDAGTEPHALAREVEDAGAVLAVAGPGAALIGHSFGGAVALELAREAAPGQISRLVLYEPGVKLAGLIPAAEVERIERHVTDGRLEAALNAGVEQLDAAGLVHSDGPVGPRPDAFLALARTLAREIRAAGELDDDLARYRTVAVPALLMVGEDSPHRQRRNCEALAAALPDVRVELLPSLGHVAHNAAPDTVSELLGGFLELPGVDRG